MDTEQQERFRKAVERKGDEAEAASRRAPQRSPQARDPEIEGDQANLTAASEPQDTLSVRDKNSGHGQKTADKWNQ